ncbi:hypothetical protein ILFOPFJJ_01728 [Ensifer psoraleae]|nr:hypothetical protein [Sinorhizobium psoraleae]
MIKPPGIIAAAEIWRQLRLALTKAEREETGAAARRPDFNPEIPRTFDPVRVPTPPLALNCLY